MRKPSFFNLVIAGILFLTVTACETAVKKEAEQDVETEVVLPSTGNFGEAITKDGSVAIADIASLITTDDTIPVKVYGSVVEVCQHTGCWLTFDLGNGENIMVNMKDHDFYVPKDAAGKKAWVSGTATRELISVDMLKHYAEDAGKSQEYIDAITEDAWQYTIEAKGVIIEE